MHFLILSLIFYGPVWSLSSQVYKGSANSFHLQNMQPNSDYRFRVCAIRQCQDAPELSGPYSPTVILTSQRSDTTAGGSNASVPGSRSSTESNRARRSLTDEQCAFLILMVFAIIAILIAFVIQYFVIKWGVKMVCISQLQGYSFILSPFSPVFPLTLCCFVSFCFILIVFSCQRSKLYCLFVRASGGGWTGKLDLD